MRRSYQDYDGDQWLAVRRTYSQSEHQWECIHWDLFVAMLKGKKIHSAKKVARFVARFLFESHGRDKKKNKKNMMIKHLKIQIVRQVVQIKDTKAFISSNWKERRWTSKTNKANITIESCDYLLSHSDIKWLIGWCCHFFVESWRDWMSSIIQSLVSNLSCCCVKVWDRLLPAQKYRNEGKMLVQRKYFFKSHFSVRFLHPLFFFRLSQPVMSDHGLLTTVAYKMGKEEPACYALEVCERFHQPSNFELASTLQRSTTVT